MPDTFPSHETMAVVIDRDSVRVFSPLNDVDALALQGCSAEDPATWDDVALIWPRYKFHPENAEFADGLPIRLVSLTEAVRLLSDVPAWFVLDLNGRRVFTGGDFPLLRLRHTPIGEGARRLTLPCFRRGGNCCSMWHRIRFSVPVPLRSSFLIRAGMFFGVLCSVPFLPIECSR